MPSSAGVCFDLWCSWKMCKSRHNINYRISAQDSIVFCLFQWVHKISSIHESCQNDVYFEQKYTIILFMKQKPPSQQDNSTHGISAKKYCYRNPTVPLGGQYFPFYFPPFLSIHLADLFQECMGKASQLKMRKTISCRSRFNFNYKAISNLYGHNRKTEFVKLASPWIHNLSSSFSLQDKTLRILLQQMFWLLRKQEILWDREGRGRLENAISSAFLREVPNIM